MQLRKIERPARGWSGLARLARVCAPRALSVLVLAASALAARPAGAAALERLSAECLPEDAYKEVEACPAGPTKFEVGGRRAAAFKTAPPPREKKSQKDSLAQKEAPE